MDHIARAGLPGLGFAVIGMLPLSSGRLVSRRYE